MSEENVNVQTNSNENTETNPSTETSNKNVPYDRFQEVVASKNEMAGQIGKLQAQIDKMNQDNKSKAEAKMVEDGKLKEALDIVTQELILKSPSVLNPVYEYVLENKIFEGEYTFSDWINGPLGFKVETGSNVINISYKDNDKDFILKVLKKISLEYKNYSTRDIEKGLVKQIKYLENQNEIMRKAAKKSMNALNEFQIKNGLGTMYGFVGENDDFSSFQNTN